MKKTLLIFALSGFFVACGGSKTDSANQSTVATERSSDSITTPEASQENKNTPEMPTVNAADISYKVFKNDSSSEDSQQGFGYDILNAGKVYVHQPHIPAVSGNKSFASEEDAKKAAMLVASKLKKGITPPTISVKELDSLGIK
ncbi:hypothetical protein BH11BAC2_BH11BAC2_17440 [soil metagenome]